MNNSTLIDNRDIELGKEFGGIDLSGGEWQRVAIARGIYRGNSLLVLDEPTAAIDPVEENEILELIHEFRKDRTLIFITHRMSIVKMADRILCCFHP